MDRRSTTLFAGLLFALCVLFAVNLLAGSASLTLTDVCRILFERGSDGVDAKILLDVRAPRAVAAAVLGGALALSGYLLQAFFANPIAGPYVLGISFSAKLAVAILMVAASRLGFPTRAYMSVGAAFIGSLFASFCVVAVAKKVRSMSALIVCGVMIGYVCSAATELIVSFADDANIVNLHNWSIGSFAASSWKDARVYLPGVGIGTAAAFALAKGIEAYLYGEEYASSLGLNVRRFRAALILASSLLSSVVTAFAGPISFVGIAAPHVVRRAFRTSDPRVVIPGSFLFGAVFCLFCDLLARRLFAPRELGVSTITAVFGAPIVISMLLNKKERRS